MNKKITQENYCNDMAVCFSLFTNIINFFMEEVEKNSENFSREKKHSMLAEVIGNMHYMWLQKSVMGKDAENGSLVAEATTSAMFNEIAENCNFITSEQIVRFEHKKIKGGHSTAVMIGTPKDKDDNIPSHINNDLGATA